MQRRQGLLGAMPVGNRWRAQGFLGGMTRYLATFDTEAEAHAVFVREKEKVDAVRLVEAKEEVDRIRSGPTFEYRGTVGRGAAHNGRRFKIVEARGPHQALVMPVEGDTPLLGQSFVVTTAYLHEVVDEPTPPAAPSRPKPEAVTVAPPVRDVTLRANVARFIQRAPHQDVFWAFEFAGQQARPQAAAFFGALTGTAGMQERAEWLRTNTFVPSDVVDAVEQDLLASLFSGTSNEASQDAPVSWVGDSED